MTYGYIIQNIIIFIYYKYIINISEINNNVVMIDKYLRNDAKKICQPSSEMHIEISWHESGDIRVSLYWL